MSGERTVSLRKDRVIKAASVDAPAPRRRTSRSGGASASGEFPGSKPRAPRRTREEIVKGDLLADLRYERDRLARAFKWKKFRIVHDAALQDMARRKPLSLEQLGECYGIGENKLERFGQDFLAVIRRHVSAPEASMGMRAA